MHTEVMYLPYLRPCIAYEVITPFFQTLGHMGCSTKYSKFKKKAHMNQCEINKLNALQP